MNAETASMRPPRPTAPRCAWRPPMPGSRWKPSSSTPTPSRPNCCGANPLGKIPVLITDDGEADLRQPRHHPVSQPACPATSCSRAIPPSGLEAERLEALADGICDCLLAHVYERRFRPEEKVHQPWLDKQWSKVDARARPARTPTRRSCRKKITAGHIALRATLGYLDLRFRRQMGEGPRPG